MPDAAETFQVRMHANAERLHVVVVKYLDALAAPASSYLGSIQACEALLEEMAELTNTTYRNQRPYQAEPQEKEPT